MSPVFTDPSLREVIQYQRKSLTQEILPEKTRDSRGIISNEGILLASKLMKSPLLGKKKKKGFLGSKKKIQANYNAL